MLLLDSDPERFLAALGTTSFFSGLRPCWPEQFVPRFLADLGNGIAKTAHNSLLAEGNHGIE